MNQVLNKCIPVPGLYVPFPFLAVISVTTLILICVLKKSPRHKQTRIVPTIIVYWSYYELPMFLIQIAFAAQFEHWFNTVATLVAVVMHFAINCYSVKTIMPAKILD